uniref:p-loop NTPase n=1 Tax=Beta vulgaris TaxID=161934 RepID=I6TC14_BETVU|nr:P-loop NTPase [Beta vulgaris]
MAGDRCGGAGAGVQWCLIACDSGLLGWAAMRV